MEASFVVEKKYVFEIIDFDVFEQVSLGADIQIVLATMTGVTGNGVARYPIRFKCTFNALSAGVKRQIKFVFGYMRKREKIL